MLNAKVKELLNQQVNKEFYSAYLYLDFSNYYETRGLDGFANWYKIQAQEERDHALLFYQYLHNNNETVTLDAIAKPDKVCNCDMAPLKAGLEHEMYGCTLHPLWYCKTCKKGHRRQRCPFFPGFIVPVWRCTWPETYHF